MFSDPLAVDWHAAFASRYESRGMGGRSLLSIFSANLSSNGMNVDQSAMAAGQMEKPARFRRVGACFLIPWQSTDMQRLRRGMKARYGTPFFRPPLFFAYIACLRKKRGGLKERRPIPLPSYLDANAACQSTARGSENTLLPSETAQVSPFGQPP